VGRADRRRRGLPARGPRARAGARLDLGSRAAAELDAADVAEAFAAYARTIGDLVEEEGSKDAAAPPPMGYWEPLSGIHPASRPARSPSTGKAPSRDELLEFVVTWLAQRVRLPVSKIDPSRSFADHGIDSMAAVELTRQLSDVLGWRVDETLLWNCATIDDVISIIDIENAAAGGEHAGRGQAERGPAPAGSWPSVELAGAIDRPGVPRKRDS
jgi:acyl carrier protein